MEPMTALVLAFQLLALFSIAGALLLYLLCRMREEPEEPPAEVVSRQPYTVLITSADTALGLQLCTHLAKKGCRVFAGMKEAQESLPAKLLSSWIKMREYAEEPVSGVILPIQLDVTREDMLREATIAMGAHMNANETGISAVVNTSGSIFRGRVESQQVHQWEHMMKTNILGSLRVAKTFVSLLRPTKGRLIYLGAGHNHEEELIAFNASRVAVEKCVEELRKELRPHDVSVVALDTCGLSGESLYSPPLPQLNTDNEGGPIQYTADVLSGYSLQVLDRALWDVEPQKRYKLLLPPKKLNFTLPCRAPLRPKKAAAGGVQTV